MRLRTHIIRLFFGTGLIKILTLIRELATAYYLGTSVIKDGFVASFTLSFLLLTPFSDILEKSTLPLYLKWKNAPQTAAFVLIQFTGVGALLGVGAWLFRNRLFGHFFKGMAESSMQIAISNCQWMLVLAILFSAGLYLSQILNAHHRYLGSESRNLILSLGVIAALVFNWNWLGIPSIFVGYVLGMGGGIALLITIAVRSRLLTWPKRAEFCSLLPQTVAYWRKGSGIGFLALIGIFPALFSQSILAAFGPAQLAAHDYASRITTFLVAMTIPTIATPLFTKLSHLEQNREFPLRLLLKIAAGFMVGFGVFFIGVQLWGKWAMHVVLVHGNFDARSLDLTFPFLYWYCAQFGIQAVMMMLNFVFMAYHKFHLYFWTNALRFAVFFAALWWGKNGIGPTIVPIAIGISIVVMVVGQVLALVRMLRSEGYKAV